MPIHVRIVTPAGLFREFDASILNVNTVDGQRGILPRHVPIVTMLKQGMMNAVDTTDSRKYFELSGGLLYFRDNQAEILTEEIKEKVPAK
ncbi:MAG: hypothetical protein IKF51_08185 [Solobacterium sp.]|nr:hypothetical protein [Solobacterium sp.]